MQSGELDQEIELQSPVESSTGGELTTTYSAVATVWAKVLSARGSEAFESARTNAREAVRVKLRYRDDVLTSWRFLWHNQAYEIQAVDRSRQRAGELWLTGQVVGAL